VQKVLYAMQPKSFLATFYFNGFVMNVAQLLNVLQPLANTPVMPVLFLGHGSPMNVLPGNDYYRSWQELGQQLGKPNAILCISAHWTTRQDSLVSAAALPKTIYDFHNFPEVMYQQNYPAQGSPELAHDIAQQLHARTATPIGIHESYGLDHGAWCVMKPMFPGADVPVFQLSVAMSREPRYHYELGRALRFLRRKGVLIIGSGNIVHNLRTMRFDGGAYDWALAFDAISEAKIADRDDDALIDFEQFGAAAQLSINSAEHYYPLLYTLGLREEKDEVWQFNATIDGASISMRSVVMSQ
jgi:4,5-DOPA dioxygenase extradiol